MLAARLASGPDRGPVLSREPDRGVGRHDGARGVVAGREQRRQPGRGGDVRAARRPVLHDDEHLSPAQHDQVIVLVDELGIVDGEVGRRAAISRRYSVSTECSSPSWWSAAYRPQPSGCGSHGAAGRSDASEKPCEPAGLDVHGSGTRQPSRPFFSTAGAGEHRVLTGGVGHVEHLRAGPAPRPGRGRPRRASPAAGRRRPGPGGCRRRGRRRPPGGAGCRPSTPRRRSSRRDRGG